MSSDINSAPTIALEAMLGLPSLPASVKKEATKSAFRLFDLYKPNKEYLEGHLKISKNFQ
jgi:hypothetical protein